MKRRNDWSIAAEARRAVLRRRLVDALHALEHDMDERDVAHETTAQLAAFSADPRNLREWADADRYAGERL